MPSLLDRLKAVRSHAEESSSGRSRGKRTEPRDGANDGTPTVAAAAVEPAGAGNVDWTAARNDLQRIVRIVERFPREYDYNHLALLEILSNFDKANDLAGFMRPWSGLVNEVLAAPQWLELLFPEQAAANPALIARTRSLRNRRYLPPQSPASATQTQAVLVDRQTTSRLFGELLDTLSTGDPREGPPFLFLRRFYLFRDLLVGHFVDVTLKPVQRAIFQQCYLQARNWRQSYAADYPYQGFERLGISGIKPTEERIARYDVDAYVLATDRVLDIGSNNGFFALALAAKAGHVEGLEFNPYLVAVANIAKDFLRVDNASFIPGDFVDFESATKYDVVCSLANHCTIDGNLAIDFEQYVAKVFSLLKPGGFLFFESHNVFGPGSGAPGDDGDLDAKFDIAERYFKVVRYRMTPAYVPAFDVDKLFVVMQRRNDYDLGALRTLRLSEAKERYGY